MGAFAARQGGPGNCGRIHERDDLQYPAGTGGVNMDLKNVRIGFAFTGSFCTFSAVMAELEKLSATGADITPIISYAVDKYDTRFGSSEQWKMRMEGVTGKRVIRTITEAEPIGPKGLFDILVVAPCTGNTLAKLAN